MEREQLIWLAGWLEGEGSFGTHKASLQPIIQGESTDLDVVERASIIAGSKLYGPYISNHNNLKKRPKSVKPYYKISLWGKPAAELMMSLYPLMGTRRRGQILIALRA